MQGLHGAWGNQPRLRFAQNEGPLQIWVLFHLDVAPLPAREKSPGMNFQFSPETSRLWTHILSGISAM
jgi:hypothetical protein